MLQILEDFFTRQSAKDEAEMAATSAQLRKANLRAFSLLDPAIRKRYEKYLAETGSPATSEIAAVQDAQRLALKRAFSVFDDWE